MGHPTHLIGFPPTERIGDRPQSLPGQSKRPGLSEFVQTFPGPRANDTNTQRVTQPTNFQSFQFEAKAQLVGAQFEMLSEPPNTRTYLEIRVTPSSGGSLAVSVNNAPANEDQASWLIPPGQSRIFEANVPQNRLFGLAVAGDVSYIITWANLSNTL